MKLKYEKPTTSVEKYKSTDVITTSGNTYPSDIQPDDNEVPWEW